MTQLTKEFFGGAPEDAARPTDQELKAYTDAQTEVLARRSNKAFQTHQQNYLEDKLNA